MKNTQHAFLVRFFYFFLRYVLRHRKNIIEKNIQFLFPDIPDSKVEDIKTGFYIHLSKLVLELTHVFFQVIFRKPKIRKQLIRINPQIWDKYIENNQTTLVVATHYSHWEALVQIPFYFSKSNTQYIGIYKPLKNKTMDHWILKARSRFGGEIIAYKKIFRYIKRNKAKSLNCCFLIDQYPTHNQASSTVNFFNQEIRFLSGVEKIARAIKCPVVFMDVHTEEDGVIPLEVIKLTDTPHSLKEGELTQKIASVLEHQIRRNPEIWLWSHRRFKDSIQY